MISRIVGMPRYAPATTVMMVVSAIFWVFLSGPVFGSGPLFF